MISVTHTLQGPLSIRHRSCLSLIYCSPFLLPPRAHKSQFLCHPSLPGKTQACPTSSIYPWLWGLFFHQNKEREGLDFRALPSVSKEWLPLQAACPACEHSLSIPRAFPALQSQENASSKEEQPHVRQSLRIHRGLEGSGIPWNSSHTPKVGLKFPLPCPRKARSTFLHVANTLWSAIK